MQRRATGYIVGGLIASGLFVLSLALAAVMITCFSGSAFLFWGMLPYAVYLFLLNVLPTEYASGKTDALVYKEVKNNTLEGKAFLSAMEIQGRLYAGESYSEIAEAFYQTDGLREDDPLYATLWEMKYRYYLEKQAWEQAADALNRLIVSADYLSDEAYQAVQIERAYLCLLQKDASALKDMLEEEESFLRSNDYRAKRLLATYAYVCDEQEKSQTLVEQAEESLQKEEIVGVRKHERLLLSYLQEA